VIRNNSEDDLSPFPTLCLLSSVRETGIDPNDVVRPCESEMYVCPFPHSLTAWQVTFEIFLVVDSPLSPKQSEKAVPAFFLSLSPPN